MLLQTVYKIEVLEIIKNFIADVSSYYGANERECFELLLASEESATHIIENYPSDMDDIFEISCVLDNEMIIVVFTNKGLPVDSHNIPHYDMKNPYDSVDGLKFFLIEKFVDSFDFKNMGNLGWQSVLQKKIANPKILKSQHTEDDFIPKGKFSVSLATPDDAYEITKLAYYTYSYSYTKTVLYYPELLSNAIANGSIISHIAKNTDGELIAHICLMRSAHSFDITEIGMMMVSPKYRKSMAILKLVKIQHTALMQKKFGFRVYFANLVSSHDGSQRLVVHFGLKPFALKLSVHEHSDILQVQSIESQRESLLYSVAFIDKDTLDLKLFIPQKHNEITKKIFEQLPVNLNISNESLDYTSSVASFSVERLKKELLGEIKVKTFGNTFYKELKTIVKKLYMEDVKSIHLYIPTDKPLPDRLEDELKKLGFFFCGIVIKTMDKWCMLYTSLGYQKFDFSKIMLHMEFAKELGVYIEKEYKNLEMEDI